MIKTAKFTYTKQIREPKLYVLVFYVEYTFGANIYYTRTAYAYDLQEAINKVNVLLKNGNFLEEKEKYLFNKTIITISEFQHGINKA